MGIGQGYLAVNRCSSASCASRLANGEQGAQPAPDQVDRRRGAAAAAATSPDLPFDQEHIAFVREAMAAVVDVTARPPAPRKLGLGPIKMAGKTGTAQSHTYGGGHGAHGARRRLGLRDHAWFIAFAPADDPRYAMSVLVEHGGFGAEAAAPKAREIMRVALLKDPEIRARIETAAAAAAAPDAGPAERRRRRRPPTPPRPTPLPSDGTAT